jgi:hypothetical protein
MAQRQTRLGTCNPLPSSNALYWIQRAPVKPRNQAEKGAKRCTAAPASAGSKVKFQKNFFVNACRGLTAAFLTASRKKHARTVFLVIACAAAGTSRECPNINCRCASRLNRKGESFRCVACGQVEDADGVGAGNIRSRTLKNLEGRRRWLQSCKTADSPRIEHTLRPAGA